jgi:hypothetical protein
MLFRLKPHRKIAVWRMAQEPFPRTRLFAVDKAHLCSDRHICTDVNFGNANSTEMYTTSSCAYPATTTDWLYTGVLLAALLQLYQRTFRHCNRIDRI